MKKILTILLGMTFLLTGCTVTKKEINEIKQNFEDKKKENIDNNTFICTADEIMYSVLYRKGEERGHFGKTIFTFNFENNQIDSISIKEEFDKEHSTEEQYKEAKEYCLGGNCKASMKNEKLILTYDMFSVTDDEGTEFFGLSKKEVKEMMEEIAEETDISIQCK